MLLTNLRRAVLASIVIAAATPVAAQEAPALTRGPYLQLPTPESVVVRWRTGAPTDSRVRYGTDPGDLDREVLGGLASCSAEGCDHELTLAGLEPGTRYYYAVGTSLADLSGGPDHTFVTPPVAGTRQPIRIWTFGDSGWGAAEQAPAVRDAYLGYTGSRGTDVWLLLGDNAYVAGTDPEYQANFFDIYPGVLRQVPAWSTFGNHENFVAHSHDESGAYYDMFTFPRLGEAGGVASGTEAYHSFDYGNVHFINLNSQDVDRVPPATMLDWLQADLAANDQEWTIVYFHHPVYSWGSHNSDTDTSTSTTSTPPTDADDFAIQDMREYFLPVLEAGGVDLVLMAHSHQYERSKLLNGHYGTSDALTEEMVLDGGKGRTDEDRPYRKTGDIFNDAHSGTVYAVVGTGAESSFAAPLHPAMAVTVHAAGSLVVDVNGARLDGTFVDADGAVRDHFTILRGDGFNFAPIARDDHVATPPATEITIPVLANDNDPDDDALLIVDVTSPTTGTATDNGDGTITYVPPRDVSEAVAHFEYTIDDGQDHQANATVTVTITCPPLADGAFFDDFESDGQPGWTSANAQPPNPLSPEWSVVEDPAARSATHSYFSAANSETSYKDDRLVSPPLHLSASSRLTFWHRYDFEYEFDGGMIEISTDGGATWSDLGEDIVAGGYNQTIFVPRDPPTDQFRDERPVWTGDSGPTMSLVEVDLGAYAGADRLLRWRLSADSIGGATGWFVDDVSVSDLVTGPGDCNLPPSATDDTATTPAGMAVEIDVLANDTDPDGDTLQISAVGLPDRGTAEVTAEQRIVYTPDAGFAGSDSFTYEISDGEFGDVARVTVTVVGTGADREEVEGHGEIDDGEGSARFALNVEIDDDETDDDDEDGAGWVRYRTLHDVASVDLRGWVQALAFPTRHRAEMSGKCWLEDGSPCTFSAAAEDHREPGLGADRFSIEVRDASGVVIYTADGVLTRGDIEID